MTVKPDPVHRNALAFVAALRAQCARYGSLCDSLERLTAYLSTPRASPTDAHPADLLDAILSEQDALLREIEQGDATVRTIRDELGRSLRVEGEVTLGKLRDAVGKAAPSPSSRLGEMSVLIDRVDALLDRLTETMVRAKRRADENERLLVKEYPAIKAEIGQVRKGRDASQAYRRTAQGAPDSANFLDKTR